MTTDTVTFDGNDLASVRGFSIQTFDPHRPPARTLNASALARADLSSVASAYYQSRKIHVVGSLARNSKSDLQQGLRDLEALLQTQNALLVGSVAGTQTEFTATKDNITLSNEGGGYADVDIEFFVSNPTGYAISATTLYNLPHLVGSAYSFAVTWAGNVAQQPVITITLNSISGTLNTITISNPTSGESLQITTAFSNGNVIVIDSKNKTVKIGGISVLYSGSIPEWSDSEPINYSDNFTVRNFDILITNQERNI